MAKKEKTKFITPDILENFYIGAFQKLDPRYMIKNPVMFVVEIGFIITLILTFFPTMFGGNTEYRIYNGIVAVILFCDGAVCKLCRICCRGTWKSPGGFSEKNQTGHKGAGTSFGRTGKNNQCV